MNRTNIDYLIEIGFVIAGVSMCGLGVVILSKIRELHLTMNSRLDQLIRATLAQGRQDERDSQAKNKMMPESQGSVK